MTGDVLEAEHAANAVRWELPRLAGRGGSAPPTARELDDLERSAHREGFERGRTEGYVAGLAEAQADLAYLRQLLGRFARPLAELDSEIEHILVHLATAVSGALTRGLAVHQPETLVALVREAVTALPAAAREVELQLHPDDVAAVERIAGREAGWRVSGNPMLARGDVRVHSDIVRLDATLATRLANATEALLEKPRHDG